MAPSRSRSDMADHKGYVYDAYIAYSHVIDTQTAAALERALQAIAKPWYLRRPIIRVSRDISMLSATPNIFSELQKYMDQSRFMIFLASPAAANSVWIRRE